MSRSNRSGDELWDRVRDAETPSDTELAAAARELASIEPATVSSRFIERVIARAGRATRRTPAPATARRRIARWIPAAAALLLCVASLAWVVPGTVWPTTPPASATLTIGAALQDVLAPGSTSSARNASFAYLDERCNYAVEQLQALAADERAEVAHAARAACNRLAATIAGRRCPSFDHAEIDVLADGPIAADPGAQPSQRVAAIVRLESLAAAALFAIRNSPCQSDDERARQRHYVGDYDRRLATPTEAPAQPDAQTTTTPAASQAPAPDTPKLVP